jgi:hypothetical protein
MKKIILPLTLAAAMTAGAAVAQPFGPAYGYGHTYGDPIRAIDARQQMLLDRIERGVETGQLTRREAWMLRTQYNDISRLEARYRWNGLSGWEVADLNRRLDALSQNVRMARRDDDRVYGYNTAPSPYYPPY